MKRANDEQIYPACWITCGLLLILFLIWRIPLGQPALPECWLYTQWQIYCPGCGGTRALEALLRGHMLLSLYYHPAVLFTAVSIVTYLFSQTLWRLRGRRGAVLQYHERWLWTIVALLALQCIVRNTLWFGFGVAL